MSNVVLSLGTRAVVAGLIPNPKPSAIPGASHKEALLFAWVKYGVLSVILLAALIGIGMIAGGRITNHHSAGANGAKVLISCVLAGILYGAAYQIFSAITA